MRVVITGGTGLIGSALTRSLLADGHQVVILTRDAAAARRKVPAGALAVDWDMRPGGKWETALDGADAVVNLAGATVAGLPWTAARKRPNPDDAAGFSGNFAGSHIVEGLSRPANRHD